MRHLRLIAMVLAVLLIAMPASAGPGKPPGKTHIKVVTVKRQGDAYCFERPIGLGDVTVAGGRCYTFYLLRTKKGAFLAFGPPGPPMIPPGQIVRLSTPAGAKHKGRLFYLVPISVPATVIKVDEIRYVPVIVTPQSDRVIVRVPANQLGQPTSSQGGTDRLPEVAFEQR